MACTRVGHFEKEMASGQNDINKKLEKQTIKKKKTLSISVRDEGAREIPLMFDFYHAPPELWLDYIKI